MHHPLAPRHFLDAVLCGLLGIAVTLPGISQVATHHGDEAFYLEIAWRMLETGNFTVPVFYDELILDRAPLFYWLIAISYRLFGFSLLAGRLPTLVAGGLLSAGVYLLSIWLYGNRRGAVYAVLVWLTFPVTTWISRLAVPDMVMTLGVVGTVSFYYRATLASRPAPWLIAASIALALATMAKGHVGLVVAGVPLALFLVADRRAPEALSWRRLLLPDFWLPALLLGGWWYLYLFQSTQLVGEVAPRSANAHQTLGEALYGFLFSEASHQVEGGWPGMQRNMRDYALGSIAWFVPWSPVVVYGFMGGARRLRAEWRDQRRPMLLLVCQAVGVFTLFTFFVLELRSMRYVLPAAPALAILVGRYFTVATVRRPSRVPILVATVCAIAWGVVYQVVIPDKLRPPLQDLCARLAPTLRPEDRIATLVVGHHWTTFTKLLLGRQVIELDEPGQTAISAADTVARRHVDYLLTRRRWATDLRAAAPSRFAVFAEGDGGSLVSKGELFEEIVLLRVVGDDPPVAEPTVEN